MSYYNPKNDRKNQLESAALNFEINLLPETYEDWVVECRKLRLLKEECLKQHELSRKQRDLIIEQWKDYVRKISEYRKFLFSLPNPRPPHKEPTVVTTEQLSVENSHPSEFDPDFPLPNEFDPEFPNIDHETGEILD